MTLSIEELKTELGQLSVVQITELVRNLEEEWGVSAAAAVAAMPMVDSGGSIDAEAVEEQTEFDVMLTSYGSGKVAVIKVVRSISSLGLKEAKELVERAPTVVKTGITREEAEAIKKKLDEVGATIEIK